MTENGTTILNIAFFAGVILLTWILMHAVHIGFQQLEKKQTGLHLLFVERVMKIVIFVSGVIIAFSVFSGIGTIWKTLLGGTAIISTVLAFAAQDVIKDILAGLMISMYKPFETGNRIELEDGTTGIVREITLRHVVLQTLDTQRVILPNSKVNTMRVRNFSYHTRSRSIQFEFHIAYGSDVEKAMEVIRQAVIDSEYSIPGKDTPDGKVYAPVYFLAFQDSSLRLATTVYFKPTAASEVVMTDINLRVSKALSANRIEIPYPYINIVQR
ncbi:MAG: mechanosensitive ion channel [Oscillospiraceae bacterium]|nr:mechanosensitive ion channel [Oscillospiraceae bacterium]